MEVCERTKDNTQSSQGNSHLRVETLIKSWSLGQALGSNLVQIEWLFIDWKDFWKCYNQMGLHGKKNKNWHIKWFEKLWQKLLKCFQMFVSVLNLTHTLSVIYGQIVFELGVWIGSLNCLNVMFWTTIHTSFDFECLYTSYSYHKLENFMTTILIVVSLFHLITANK